MHEFFSFNFPLREHFFCTSTTPTSHKFPTSPSLRGTPHHPKRLEWMENYKESKRIPSSLSAIIVDKLRWEAGGLMVNVLCSCLTPPRAQLFERTITLSTAGQISIYWIAQLVFLMPVRRIVSYPWIALSKV